MKVNRVSAAIFVLAGAAVLMLGQLAHGATLRCVGADGKTACTVSQQSALNDALASGKRMHKPMLIEVLSFSFGANGTIVCKQTGGKDCDDAHVSAVLSLSSSSKSPDGAFKVVPVREASSGMASGK